MHQTLTIIDCFGQILVRVKKFPKFGPAYLYVQPISL